MAKKRSRNLLCEVVSEEIQAVLKQKFTIRFGAEPEYYAQCDQEDCQYVDENKLPCPLSLEMFKEDLAMIKAKKEERRAGLL